MSNAVREMAMRASKRYLEVKNYEILEDGENLPTFDFIAIDNDDNHIVFITVAIETDISNGFKKSGVDMSEKELSACSWLALNADQFGSMQIRFDEISIVVFNHEKAMIRHHINCEVEGC